MARVQKTLEEQLAEAQAKRAQLDRRLKMLAEKQKSVDLRRRAKAEKVLLRALLEQAAVRPEFREVLVFAVRETAFKSEDKGLALWLLGDSNDQAHTPQEAANAA